MYVTGVFNLSLCLLTSKTNTGYSDLYSLGVMFGLDTSSSVLYNFDLNEVASPYNVENCCFEKDRP